MKLQELIDKIKASPKVQRVDFIEKHPPYYFYRVRTKEAEDLVREFAVCIIVENEGAEDEVAYFKGSKPIIERTTSPIEQAKNKIIEKCGFIKLESLTVRKEEQYGLAIGFVSNQDGTVSRKTFLVYLDESKNLVVNEVI